MASVVWQKDFILTGTTSVLISCEILLSRMGLIGLWGRGVNHGECCCLAWFEDRGVGG